MERIILNVTDVTEDTTGTGANMNGHGADDNTTGVGAAPIVEPPFNFKLNLREPAAFLAALQSHNETAPEKIGIVTGAILLIGEMYKKFERTLQTIKGRKDVLLRKVEEFSTDEMVAVAETKIAEQDKLLEDEVRRTVSDHQVELENYNAQREEALAEEKTAKGNFLENLVRLTGQDENHEIKTLSSYWFFAALVAVFVFTLVTENLGGVDIFNEILGKNASVAAVLLLSVGLTFAGAVMASKWALLKSHSGAKRALKENFPNGYEVNGKLIDRVYNLDPMVKTYVKLMTFVVLLILVPIIAVRIYIVQTRLDGDWAQLSSTGLFVIAFILGTALEFFLSRRYPEVYVKRSKMLQAKLQTARKALAKFPEKTPEESEEELQAKLAELAAEYTGKIGEIHSEIQAPLDKLTEEKSALLVLGGRLNNFYEETFQDGLLRYVENIVNHIRANNLGQVKDVAVKEAVLDEFSKKVKRDESLYATEDLRDMEIPTVELPLGIADPESRIKEIREAMGTKDAVAESAAPAEFKFL